MQLTWYNWHHRELTSQRLYDILALRSEVFVVEQRCAYLDVDGRDLLDDNRHIAGYRENQLIAYARILADGPVLAIGRVVISPQARGMRMGQRLMEQALAACEAQWPGKKIHLSAQVHLQGFYGHFGFKPVTDAYDEDGIMHIGMEYQ